MLAKRVGELPPGEEWIFEPKWDGFRTLIFRDGDEVFIQSRDEKPLNRYFPELIDPLKAQLPERCVLDGEIVIATSEGLEFDTLQMRLHPAASRVNKLAEATPASIVFFDLLCEGDKSLCDIPFAKRRARLEALLKNAEPPLHLTPATRERSTAADWFQRFEGAGLDGVVAKPEDVKVAMVEGERTNRVEVTLASDDVGKVIGRGGRNIDAIRAVVRAAALKNHDRVMVEIV